MENGKGEAADMKNPYKRTDVFVCNYKTHSKFQNQVSAYHVMRVKKCYPQGCISFRWFCDVKGKGKKCPRKYEYVGRLCEGCFHFNDEKVHYQPKIKISQQEFKEFQQELEDFDDWLFEVSDRETTLWGRVAGIKPCFIKEISSHGGSIRLHGYLLILQEGYIGNTFIEDYLYARISPHQQENLHFALDDQFEARGILKFDHGRLVFSKLWKIEFEERSGRKAWNNSQALVARQIATQFKSQPEMCLHCPHGALVDVIEKHEGAQKTGRELYCLEGVEDYRLCAKHAYEKLNLCRKEPNYN